MLCTHCQDSLPDEGDFVTCDKCTSNYHYECSGVKKSTLKGKIMKTKNECECQKCRTKTPRTQSVEEEPQIEDPAFQALKKLLENVFQKQEMLISDRVDKSIAVVTQLEERFIMNLDQMKKLEEKTILMEREIEVLKVTIEREKQYSRSKNFIITSILSTEKEDVNEFIIRLLSSMNLNITKREFTAHRLPPNETQAAIIVQCCTRDTRDIIVRNARKHRPKLFLINDVQPDRNIYFNDQLTPYFSSLMAKANSIRKGKGYRYIWMNSDKTMVRKDNMSKAIQVVKQEDLNSLV